MEVFDEYVVAAWPRLVRSAWMLTTDWHRAEDLAQTALARVCRKWHRIRDDNPDAYLRAIMTTTYLTWWRRRWRAETPYATPPEQAAPETYHGVDLRVSLARALARLPRQQRAVLMLRYQADMTEAQTAQVLGISVGTVKSHTSRALASLRQDPALVAGSADLLGALE